MSNNREISAFTFFSTLFLGLFLFLAVILDLSRLNATPEPRFTRLWSWALVIIILIHCYRSIKRSFSSFLEKLKLTERLRGRKKLLMSVSFGVAFFWAVGSFILFSQDNSSSRWHSFAPPTFLVWVVWSFLNLILLVKIKDDAPVSRKKKVFSLLAILAVPVAVLLTADTREFVFVFVIAPCLAFVFFKFILSHLLKFLKEMFRYILQEEEDNGTPEKR